MVWGNGFENQRGAEGAVSLGVVTLVIGTALGVAAALFLASSGSRDLQTRLRNTTEDWRSSAADALARGRERMVSAVEQNHGMSSGSGVPPVDRGAVKPA